MPKYRVLEQSFINNVLVNLGDVIEFDGVPGSNLEPIDKAAKAAASSPEAVAANSPETAAAAAANSGQGDTAPLV